MRSAQASSAGPRAARREDDGAGDGDGDCDGDDDDDDDEEQDSAPSFPPDTKAEAFRRSASSTGGLPSV